MRMAWLWLVLVMACERNYNRAALVPHATPRMTTGQPLEGRGQLSLGASSVAHLGDPEVGDDPNAGIELPGTQLFGALKGRLGKVALGILYENGLAQGAKKLNASQPDVEGGNVQGYGFTLDFSIPVDTQWSVGFGVDTMLWSVPYTSYDLYADGTFLVVDEGSDIVATLAASVTPSYRLDKDLALFGGLTIRQHPTIEQKGMDVGTILDDIEVESGPANYILSAGVEAALADGAVSLAAVAYYDLSRAPAKYGPGMGLMVSLPFGRRAKPAPAPAYAPVYGPPSAPQPYPPAPM